MKICQIVLMEASSNADKPYGLNERSKYRNEIQSPQPSKIGGELGTETIDSNLSTLDQNIINKVNEMRVELDSNTSGKKRIIRQKDIYIFFIATSATIIIQDIGTSPLSLEFKISCLFFAIFLVLYIISKNKNE